MNKVWLIGRLTKKPELRYTGNNTPVATFTLAVNRLIGEETDFINIVIWNKQAEVCEKYLDKRSQIAVVGKITTRSYEKDGQKRYVTEVVAENVQFLDAKKQDNATNQNVERTNASNDPFVEMGDIVEQDLPF